VFFLVLKKCVAWHDVTNVAYEYCLIKRAATLPPQRYNHTEFTPESRFITRRSAA